MENRFAIALLFAFSLVTGCYLLVDLAARYLPPDYDEIVTRVFCFGTALFFVVIASVVMHIARSINYRKVAAICSLFMWLSVANLIDETIGNGAHIAKLSEYVLALISIVFAICEYHKVTALQVMKIILNFCQIKIALCQKYLSNWLVKIRK